MRQMPEHPQRCGGGHIELRPCGDGAAIDAKKPKRTAGESCAARRKRP